MVQTKSIRAVTFGAATSHFILRGNFPSADLIPIIPPGAKVSKNSGINSEQIGKIPGVYSYSRKEWYGLTGQWAIKGLSQEQIDKATAWPTDNIGLRAEHWPALDLDTNSEEVRDVIISLAEQRLGNAPTRVRDNAPRALLVYRHTGEEPLRKMKIIFKCNKGISHAVEFLGLGQQYLIHGTHKTGSLYEWQENADLATWGAEGLCKITAQDARAFMDVLRTEILARKWTLEKDLRLSGTSARTGMPVDQLEPVVSVETALAALNAIPNNFDILPLREDLVGVLAAFRAAIGKESTKPEVFEECRDWAVKYDWATDAYFDEIWKSLTHVKVGPQRLFGLAHKHGWIGDAVQDFKDNEEADTAINAARDEQAAADEALRLLAKQVVYWSSANRWIERETNTQFSVQAFNQAPGLGISIAPAGAAGLRAASNILLNSSYVQTVSGMTYLPGEPQLVTWELNGIKNIYWNKWSTNPVPQMTVTNKDITIWLDHVHYLFSDGEDREYLLDFLAHVLQKRGRKIRWAPVIVGNQGIGKDLFLRPIVKGLGGQTNAQTVQPERLNGTFIDFWEKELLIVEEISRSQKTDVYERLKAIVSGTVSDTVTIERKFQQPYEIPLVVNMLFFTNHSDALSLTVDDRRFFVIHSYAEPKDNAYYAKLVEFYNNQGWQKVYNWLLKRDIAEFNPDARPRFNDAKRQMIEESAPFYMLWMRDEYLPSRSVVLVKDVLQATATDLNIPSLVREKMLSQAQVTKALKFAGWVSRQTRWDRDTRVQLWCKTDEIANSSADLLKARYIAEINKKLVNVR